MERSKQQPRYGDRHRDLHFIQPRVAVAATILALFVISYCESLFADVTMVGTGGTNATQHIDKNYLILVSIDGFRWDYLDHYPAPNLARMAAKGVRAERLVPVFPTLTFPNHYSIATGLYPVNHGIVANEFPDDALGIWYQLSKRETVENRWFYRGEPIWVTAETQGMVAASFYFVGSEADINGVRPTHWRSYDKRVDGTQRVEQVLEWLAEPDQNRPHMITLYFEDVDDNSHWYGVGSGQSIEAIKRVDDYLGQLFAGLQELPHGDRVNIIVVSDHGQAAYHLDQEPFVLEDHVDLENSVSIEGGSYLYLHFDPDDPERARQVVNTVNEQWDHGRAYLPDETPASWRTDGGPRYPDVILQPQVGYAVLSGLEKAGKLNAGDHGWAPEAPAMHGIFIASGPDIKPGVSLGPVNSIDVYPLMISILGLTVPEKQDGNFDVLRGLIYSDGQ
jgi:predicted AlkP superfamily pyrophosphatase or phosphodiesterase